jgi:dCMP deaminase
MNLEKDKKQYTFDRAFINMAEEIAELSKCVSHNVGCVVAKENRVVSTGYNGTPANYYNCNEVFSKQFDREQHRQFSNKFEIHAEMNAILFAARNGISVDNSSVYCTHTPCEVCLKNLIQCNISRIIYKYEYDSANIDNEILNELKRRDILFYQFKIN